MTTRVKEKTLAPSKPEFGQPLVIQDCFLGFLVTVYIYRHFFHPPEIVSTENYSLSLLPTVLSPSVVFCCCRQFRFPGERSALICFLLLRSGKPGHGPADSTCRKPEGGFAATDKKVVLLFLDVYKLIGKGKYLRSSKLITLASHGAECGLNRNSFDYKVRARGNISCLFNSRISLIFHACSSFRKPFLIESVEITKKMQPCIGIYYSSVY